MFKFVFRFLLLSTSLFISQQSMATDPFVVELYDISCKACHSTGAGDAPKVFDQDDWQPRLEKGKDALLANAVAGYKGMPPLGMCGDCTKEDLQDLIDYMSSPKK